MTQPLIEFSNVTKNYGALRANDDLSFAINRGSIHAIIGENGAGKTTAMKLLFGLEAPSAGEILYNGAPRSWTSPRGAMAAGIGMVHQHFMLSPVHSALDNVILGRETGTLGGKVSVFARSLLPINREKLLAELDLLAKDIGFEIPWNEPAGLLPVGIQQQLEIIKLLHAGVDLMIFDEPTAVLSPDETRNFLLMIKSLNKLGRTVIIITHKLKEVKAVADRITVLRRGKSVGTVACDEVSVQDMADLMVGRHVHLGDLSRAAPRFGDPILTVRNLTITHKGREKSLMDLSLTIRSGQVIGIAGVEGSGQSELFNFIRDPHKAHVGAGSTKGEIEILGQNAARWTNHDVRLGSIAIVPADRLREAILPEETLLENDLLGHDHEFGIIKALGRQWIDRISLKQRLLKELAAFDVRPPNPDAVIGGLSGGNQQKFVMARELSRNPKLILCAQPTRGVDVGSIEQIHGEILNRRDQGAGILLISSQIEELMALSDVIHVMFDGAIVATFVRGEFDEGKIGMAMGGGLR